MKHLYEAAIGFSTLAVLCVAWLTWQAAVFFLPPYLAVRLPIIKNDNVLITSLVVAAACLVVSTVGTAATILVGWRHDRQQIEGLKLRQATSGGKPV